MKKIIAAATALLVAAGMFTGCGASEKPTAQDDKLKIVTTIFPEYDWTREILGDQSERAEVTMLLDNGVDLHSYQPTADDLIKIAECDLFIYVGGESDGWVESALASTSNPDRAVINLIDTLGDSVKLEEVVEGMQETEHDHEEDEEHAHDADEEHTDADEQEAETDEHVWLSLRNAQAVCQKIAEKLGEIDPEHEQAYTDNALAYIDQLAALDAKYQAAVDAANKKTLVFGGRFPFRYLTEDYGLDYYAAFVGCSAETEASFETIRFLAEKTDALGLSHVLTIENPNHKIAETVVANTSGKNQQVLSMDSMQSVTSKDVAAGATYLSVMEHNLDVLTQALQ
ncbi:metal ABC transporter substrate-binding protein [Butyricicoccus pullicaecorum]|uniref:metal ABC transporter substrate-binding protein n=1 Tax=Butyricicoccus pullicaecorum TaxID=501571 RepID=UPI00351FFAC8